MMPIAQAGSAARVANRKIYSAMTIEDTADSANENTLRQTLLEYQSILDNASLGITFTRNRKFLHCNTRFSEMFGWNSNELVGQTTDIVYPTPADFIEMSRIATPILSAGARLDVEVVLKKRDGATFWCRILAKAIDAADSSRGTIFIAEDITERKRTEQALIDARDELERRVQQRTTELATANARLQAEIHERHAAEAQIRHLANHDVLTGLPNRRLLEDRLDQALLAAKRNTGQVAVQFIDLDHFKLINDRLGHRVGDLLLQAVAERLRGLLREMDTVSRISGDEFILVLSAIHSVAAVHEMAEKILEALEQPYLLDGHLLTITPSIGISLYPAHGDDAALLISRADAAMYQAKRMGRKNYRVYDPNAEQMQPVHTAPTLER